MRIEKTNILEVAHEIFLKKGYKKTNISEIASKSGIAAGTFYNYYDSKESLFLEVYVKENEKIRNNLIVTLDLNNTIEELIEKIFEYSIDKVTNNKILAEWNNKPISDILHNYYSSDGVRKNYVFHNFLRKTFSDILKDKKYDNKVVEEFMRVYDLIYYLDMHITSSEFEGYEKTLKILVSYFCKGLFSK